MGPDFKRVKKQVAYAQVPLRRVGGKGMSSLDKEATGGEQSGSRIRLIDAVG